jgi:hypothetical protein
VIRQLGDTPEERPVTATQGATGGPPHPPPSNRVIVIAPQLPSSFKAPLRNLVHQGLPSNDFTPERVHAELQRILDAARPQEHNER